MMFFEEKMAKSEKVRVVLSKVRVNTGLKSRFLIKNAKVRVEGRDIFKELVGKREKSEDRCSPVGKEMESEGNEGGEMMDKVRVDQEVGAKNGKLELDAVRLLGKMRFCDKVSSFV